jgi:hypothetical protein
LKEVKMAQSKEVTGLLSDSKNQISVLERQITKLKKEQTKLSKLHEGSRKKLGKAYDTLMELVDQLAEIRVHGTQKESGLKKRIKVGRAENLRLTKVRNDYLAEIDTHKEKLNELGIQLMVLRERELNKIDGTDEIVTQVFALNEAMVQASAAREDCLNRHVFPLLLDEDGKMRSQITFLSSDGLKKVVAMVNTMTIIRGDLADEAQREIQKFFDRFQKPAKEEPHLEAMLEITRQLFVTKTKFTPGPLLYRFITMQVDSDMSPELARAQLLIKQSLRSEKTNSYIRLYARPNRNEKFQVVPQS